MQSYSEKVVVVTGAASGIGRALAQQLSMQGANLALSDVNMEALEETASILRGTGKVTLQKLDVADRGAWEAYAEQVKADHGQVDMIINNAGVALSETVERMSYEDMEWIVNINFSIIKIYRTPDCIQPNPSCFPQLLVYFLLRFPFRLLFYFSLY